MSDKGSTSTAIYVGRRITTKDKICFFWRWNDEKEIRGFDKQIAPASIGELWTFTHSGDGTKFYVAGDDEPKRTCEADESDKLTQQWIGEDQLARRQMQNKRARKKLAARKDAFERRIAPLREIVRNLPTHADRSAFIEHVSKELWKL